MKLGYRRKLEKIADDAQRQAEFDRMVAQSYEMGHGFNIASYFEIDNVIDPAQTRFWLTQGAKSAEARGNAGRAATDGKFLDTW